VDSEPLEECGGLGEEEDDDEDRDGGGSGNDSHQDL
jgi:hypothetical protein